jgi:septum site-determining protein MinC
MVVAARSNPVSSFELKSAALTLIALQLKSPDLVTLARDLDAMATGTAGLFEHDPVVLDFSPLRDGGDAIDMAALLALLRRHGMVPVAAKGGSAGQMAAALEQGLAEAPEGLVAPSTRAPVPPEPQPLVTLTEVVHEVVREVPAPAAVPTMVIDRPLRSGQQVYARGGDLVVLGVVNFGAEVIADGSIHVYAPLRGRAVAGAKGDTQARIYATCMEAQLISIAGTYRTTDTALPSTSAGKAALVRLDGERLVVEPLGG